MRFWLFILLVSAMSAPLSALPRLREIVPRGTDLLSAFPAREESLWTETIRGVNVSHNFTQVLTADKTNGVLIMDARSGRWDFFCRLDRELSILNYHFNVKSPDIRKAWGCDWIDVRRSADGKALVAGKYIQGALKERKRHGYNGDILENNSVMQVLRGILLSGKRSSFWCDVLVADGWRLTVELILHERTDFMTLSPGYDFPSELKAKQNGRRYFVYEMRVAGFAGVVYPHKFYMLLGFERPHQPEALWGGEPKWATFHTRIK